MEPKTKKEIMEHLGYADEKGFTKRHMKPLLNSGIIVMTIPDKPRSRNQRYVTVVKMEDK